jgi:FeS assembly SUF system protein
MNLFKWLSKAEKQEPQEAAPVVPGLKGRVIEALRTVYDPELPVNIYDLGLVYELIVEEASGVVHIRMTLTAPGCPVAQTFPGVVEQAVEAVPGVSEATVELVWDPPWSRERMSEAARLDLGLV